MAGITLNARHQKLEVAGGKKAWVTRVHNYSRITTDEFANHVANDVHMPFGTVKAAIGAIVTQMDEMLLNGHSIVIEGVGSFRLTWNNKQSDTLEGIKANNPHKLRILYTPTPDLRWRMNTAKVSINII